MIETGADAPGFELGNEDGGPVELPDLRDEHDRR